MSKDVTLSELQMDIMRVLWQRGEATVAEVHQDLLAHRDLAPTTVATMLSRLEKRGLLDHRTEGRQNIYLPQVTEGEVRRGMVGDLVRQVFRGDFKALVSHLVKDNEISGDDLDAIRALIEDAEKREKR